MPFLYFYKYLARRAEFCKRDLTKFQKLELWIPDTVVFNESDAPYWIYTNHEGVVCRTENFSERYVVSKLGNQYSIDELVVCCKYVTSIFNICRLIIQTVELWETSANLWAPEISHKEWHLLTAETRRCLPSRNSWKAKALMPSFAELITEEISHLNAMLSPIKRLSLTKMRTSMNTINTSLMSKSLSHAALFIQRVGK